MNKTKHKNKMKLLAMTLMTASIIMAGCGSTEDTTVDTKADKETVGTANNESTPDGFGIQIKGVSIVPNAKMDQIVEELGEPDNYFESESCAFQGLDKVYTYGSVIVKTYPEEGQDYVYTIELKDDTVTTAEGAYIGLSKEDIIASYGNDGEDSGNALTYTKGSSVLAFIFEDEKVSSITYTAITE